MTMERESGAIDFIVKRQNLAECRFVPAEDPTKLALTGGEALVAVDRFA